MRDFSYDSPGIRVVFGAGSLARTGDELARLGLSRVLLITTRSQRAAADQLAQSLAPLVVGINDRVLPHVPLELAEAARAQAAELHADGCVAIGGGSAIGLAKAIALTTDLPIVAIPTTYSGSEMTTIWGVTEGTDKRTGRDQRVMPRTAIYDPVLTRDLPVAIAATSGMNALAHCIEALYAHDGNPITALMAEEGIRALGRSLPVITATPGDMAARADALYGAWLAGSALAVVSMGLHHKLCHTLGGRFGLPHADVHTVLLPHTAAYNQAAAPDALARAARALGAPSAPLALFELAGAIGAPRSLQAIGMPAGGLDEAADLAVASPYPNPAPLTRAGIRRLLENAYYGRPPE